MEVLLCVLMLLFPVLVTLLSFVFSAENLMQRSEVSEEVRREPPFFCEASERARRWRQWTAGGKGCRYRYIYMLLAGRGGGGG